MSDVLRWRRDLAACPELGFAEVETSAYVASVLMDIGLSSIEGIGATGVVATLQRGSSDRSIGLRADMDALAIGGGPRHACGHDGHMAMLLGAAQLLVQDGGFDGSVHFVFQPAEEHGKGAKAMIADGLFERFPMTAMFGIHNMPGAPTGMLATRVGALMASEDNFEIRIHGVGGHAARPQMVIDPIVIGAEVVVALQSIVARSVDPAQSAVVSCTDFITDGARNAIPGAVIIRGDTRSFELDVQKLIERRMRELVAGICSAHGARGEVTYTHEFAPTVNAARCVEDALAAATRVNPSELIDGECLPWLASEDFGAFAEVVPACFMLLGNGEESHPLHSQLYEFNDEALDTGVRYTVELVRTVLGVRT